MKKIDQVDETTLWTSVYAETWKMRHDAAGPMEASRQAGIAATAAVREMRAAASEFGWKEEPQDEEPFNPFGTEAKA